MAAAKGNKYALGNNGGRPAFYENAEQLLEQVVLYFDECNENAIKTTVTGLTLFLGFSSRSSLDAYEKKGEEFEYIIKRAKLAVENGYEISGQTIDIFALKNMGWRDRTEVEQSGSISISWNEERTYETKSNEANG